MRVGDLIKAEGIGVGIIISTRICGEVIVHWLRKGAFALPSNTSKESVEWLEMISAVQKEL